MERVKSWDWSMLVLALGIGAMGLKLLLARPETEPRTRETARLTSPATAAGVPLTPRLILLLSDADR